MNEFMHIEEVFSIIDQTLQTYSKDRDRMQSISEHVHHQSAIDALLILKSQLKLLHRIR